MKTRASIAFDLHKFPRRKGSGAARLSAKPTHESELGGCACVWLCAVQQKGEVQPSLRARIFHTCSVPAITVQFPPRCRRHTWQRRVAAAAPMLVAASAPAPATAPVDAAPKARAGAAAAAPGDVHLAPQRAEARGHGHVDAPAEPCADLKPLLRTSC